MSAPSKTSAAVAVTRTGALVTAASRPANASRDSGLLAGYLDLVQVEQLVE